jgi:hypothetical protein
MKVHYVLGTTISGTPAKFETLEILNPDGMPGALPDKEKVN